MKTINKKNTFNSVFEIDETYENNNWLRVKIRTFAFNKNRNGSDILDSTFNDFTKARGSIGAVPIVAKYNDESDNLEGHNVTLRKNKNDEYEIFYDTDALGFTSPTASFYLEEVNEGTEEESDYKTYVVIEDVYLWKRFDATKKIIEWFEEGTIPSVSMEIDEVEGQFDSDGYFQIQDFSFIGIAALGTDVEPCFKKAEIQMYATNEFRSDLKTLMSELGGYSLVEGGNKEMAKENKEKTVVEPAETPVTKVLDMFTEAQFAEAIEMNNAFNSTDETDSTDVGSVNPENSEETFEVTDESNSDTDSNDTDSTGINSEVADTTPNEFALTASQLREQIRIAIGTLKHTDQWGDTCRKYWYVDHTDTVAIVEDYQDGYQLYSVDYTLEGDTVTVHTDTAFKVKVEYVPFEGESVAFSANLERFNVLEKQSTEAVKESHKELNENYATLTSDHEILKGQLSELQAYKRQTEESEIKAKFEGKLSDEEFSQVFSEMKESTLESIEERLFALIGKKNFEIQSTQTKDTNKIKIVAQVVEAPVGEFDVLKKYL